MNKATSYIPKETHTLTAYIVSKDANKAIDFYKKVFGAKEVDRIKRPDGGILHACIQIGDSKLFLTDEMPGMNCGVFSPETLKGATATIHMFVENVDEVFQRAVDAGAKTIMPPMEMFWGDKYGSVIDPFGQPWSIATHLYDLTSEELQQRGEEAMKQMCASTAKA